MIRINLLPPEFRKRGGGGASKDKLALVAGIAISVVVVLFWGYVQYVRIPAAEQQITKLKADLAAATARADKVRALEKKIASIKARVDYLEGLVKQKMHWAGTLSDFADMLGRDRWSVGGFQVSCGRLTIAQSSDGGGSSRGRRGGAGKSSVQFSFTWSMELVGQDTRMSGAYVEAFFKDVEQTDFWIKNGFVGRPVEPYRGDRPQILEDIERVGVSHQLLWVRSKEQQEANLKVLADKAKAAEKASQSGGDEAKPNSRRRGAATKGDS